MIACPLERSHPAPPHITHSSFNQFPFSVLRLASPRSTHPHHELVHARISSNHPWPNASLFPLIRQQGGVHVAVQEEHVLRAWCAPITRITLFPPPASLFSEQTNRRYESALRLSLPSVWGWSLVKMTDTVSLDGSLTSLSWLQRLGCGSGLMVRVPRPMMSVHKCGGSEKVAGNFSRLSTADPPPPPPRGISCSLWLCKYYSTIVLLTV